MIKLFDYILTWTPQHCNFESMCRVSIFHHPRIRDHVLIIVTELECNPGKSVTNEIEKIAEYVLKVHGTPKGVQFVEHYSFNGKEEDT